MRCAPDQNNSTLPAPYLQLHRHSVHLVPQQPSLVLRCGGQEQATGSRKDTPSNLACVADCTLRFRAYSRMQHAAAQQLHTVPRTHLHQLQLHLKLRPPHTPWSKSVSNNAYATKHSTSTSPHLHQLQLHLHLGPPLPHAALQRPPPSPQALYLSRLAAGEKKTHQRRDGIVAVPGLQLVASPSLCRARWVHSSLPAAHPCLAHPSHVTPFPQQP